MEGSKFFFLTISEADSQFDHKRCTVRADPPVHSGSGGGGGNRK